MKVSNRAGIFLIYLSCCWLSVFAQQQTGSAPAAGQLLPAPTQSATAVNHLVLDVAVTDRTGKAITGLDEKDFIVLDNGHPQTILSFHAVGGGAASANVQPADQPVKIILLVDEVNTSFNKVSYEREQI